MTELQLRLWCLWMCEEFAGMTEDEAWLSAIEGAPVGMQLMMCSLRVPLAAWELSERMP